MNNALSILLAEGFEIEHETEQAIYMKPLSIIKMTQSQMDKDLGYCEAIADAKATVRNSNAISDDVKELICLRLSELGKEYRKQLLLESV